MLFRRFSKSIREHDWFAVSIDFVILVVGVFIGLQVTEWSEARSERAREREALEAETETLIAMLEARRAAL